MGVNRGLGDLKVTCIMSRRSANWSEIIDIPLDDPGAGFIECYEFDFGPALRKKIGTHPKFPCFGILLDETKTVIL